MPSGMSIRQRWVPESSVSSNILSRAQDISSLVRKSSNMSGEMISIQKPTSLMSVSSASEKNWPIPVMPLPRNYPSRLFVALAIVSRDSVMTRIFRSLRLKIFLMFTGSIITLYLVNLYLITSFGKTELTNIYVEKISIINSRWNDEVFLRKTENELKKNSFSAWNHWWKKCSGISHPIWRAVIRARQSNFFASHGSGSFYWGSSFDDSLPFAGDCLGRISAGAMVNHTDDRSWRRYPDHGQYHGYCSKNGRLSQLQNPSSKKNLSISPDISAYRSSFNHPRCCPADPSNPNNAAQCEYPRAQQKNSIRYRG